MCNIAGYTGVRPAAPILIEMIAKQQGFSGGYFTGIATVAEGKLLSRKRQGDLDYLLSHTDAAALPGNCGILHSRSNGSGGDLFAHPFIGGKGEEGQIAYVANGIGSGSPVSASEKKRIAQMLFDAGYRMGTERGISGYLTLANGATVHISDVMCQLITYYMDGGFPAAQAMLRGFTELASKIVGLLIHREEGDRIYFARYNFPMFAAFDENGCYLSSTPLAFPEKCRPIVPIPPMSYGYATPAGITILPMPAPAIRVAELDDYGRVLAYEKLIERLNEGKVSFGRLVKTVEENLPPLPDGSDCYDSDQITHSLLLPLYRKGILSLHEENLPGFTPGCTVPKTLFSKTLFYRNEA